MKRYYINTRIYIHGTALWQEKRKLLKNQLIFRK